MICRRLLQASPITQIRCATTSPQSAKVRRLLRRQISVPPENVRPVVSATRCEHYNLSKAVSQLTGNGMGCRIMDNGEFAHVKYKPDAEILVLANGSVVGWNVAESEIVSKVLPLLQPAETGKIETEAETEDMDYVEEETEDNVRSGMIGDVIYVHGKDAESRLRDKMAFSSGMARHTKLSALEVTTDKLIAQIKVISAQMSAGQRPSMNQRDLVLITGKILHVRGALNLYSSIVDTPDWYWSQPEQENLYELISRKLDVEPRIEILNKKLDYAADMVSILRNYLSERENLRLEWMIIILITIEVVFELKHLFV